MRLRIYAFHAEFCRANKDTHRSMLAHAGHSCGRVCRWVMTHGRAVQCEQVCCMSFVFLRLLTSGPLSLPCCRPPPFPDCFHCFQSCSSSLAAYLTVRLGNGFMCDCCMMYGRYVWSLCMLVHASCVIVMVTPTQRQKSQCFFKSRFPMFERLFVSIRLSKDLLSLVFSTGIWL